MKIAFGTDGWRAIVGEEFTPDNVSAMIQAFADLYPSLPEAGRPIVVGYDKRNQSPETAQLVANILTANGITTYLSSDFCPTPVVSWQTVHLNAAAGIVVTASHNPPSWNGIKFKESYGGAASPEYTDPIEAQMAKNAAAGRTVPERSADADSLLHTFDPKGAFVEHLRQFVDLDRIHAAGHKVLYDAMYGAGAGFFDTLLNNVTELHAQRDLLFGGIHPEPIRPYVDEAMATMRDGDYDICIITDGDADRIGAVDEHGNYVTSHEIYACLLKHAVEHRGWSGNAIKSITTTRMIDRLCDKYGMELTLTPVGFKHISPALKDPNMLIGGEESGGIGLPKHLCERDGLLCGLLLLEMMAVHGKTLGELVAMVQADVGPCAYRRVDLKLSPEQMDAAKTQLATLDTNTPTQLCGQNVTEFTRIDGYHFLREDESWLLIRPSGTEPLLRTYAEARSTEDVDALLETAQELLGLKERNAA